MAESVHVGETVTKTESGDSKYTVSVLHEHQLDHQLDKIAKFNLNYLVIFFFLVHFISHHSSHSLSFPLMIHHPLLKHKPRPHSF